MNEESLLQVAPFALALISLLEGGKLNQLRKAKGIIGAEGKGKGKGGGIT